jgi:hypothetical protein
MLCVMPPPLTEDEYKSAVEALPLRAHHLAATALSVVVACAMLGALTNAINGAVSPTYFVSVMAWDHGPHLYARVVAQGVFEGLCFGIMLGAGFTVGVGLLTRARAPLGFALRHVGYAWLVALLSWVLGGLAAVGLAALSPAWYGDKFRGAPEGGAELLRYAWVGGSIWGVELGGIVGLVLALVVLRASWRRYVETQARAPARF